MVVGKPDLLRRIKHESGRNFTFQIARWKYGTRNGKPYIDVEWRTGGTMTLKDTQTLIIEGDTFTKVRW